MSRPGSPPPPTPAGHATPIEPAPGVRRWRWLDRPVGAILTASLIVLTLLAPHWLLRDHLQYPRLRGDDFAFLIASRSGSQPLAHLFQPHNAHVVPAFRLMTAAIARVSGSVGNLADAFGWANALGLTLLMLNVAHLVGWETRRLGPSLLAMGLVGISTVLTASVQWYSAGQTLWAAQAIVATILAVQLWRLRGGTWLLIAAAVGALVSPMFWTGGLVAGPAAAAYLWATAEPRSRRSAWWPLVGTALAVGLGLVVAGGSLCSSVSGESVGLLAPLRALGLSAQAVVEALVLGLCGVNGPTTMGQAVILVGLLTLAWWWFRRGASPVPNPLEASGLVMIVLGYGLSFTLRSRFDYDNLRELAWYNTIPFTGLVLVLAGWWSSARGLLAAIPGRPCQPTGREALALLALIGALLTLHLARAQAQLLASVPPLLPSEQTTLPIPELQRLRARIWDEDLAGRQRRSLIRLETAVNQARAQGIGRDALRAVFGRIEVPGWPPALRDVDALDLFDVPATSAPEGLMAARRLAPTLAPLLRVEPPLRPTWIGPADPWPPPERAAVAPQATAGQDDPAALAPAALR